MKAANARYNPLGHIILMLLQTLKTLARINTKKMRVEIKSLQAGEKRNQAIMKIAINDGKW